MATWILLVSVFTQGAGFFPGGGSALTVIEFNSQETCLAAQKALREKKVQCLCLQK